MSIMIRPGFDRRRRRLSQARLKNVRLLARLRGLFRGAMWHITELHGRGRYEFTILLRHRL
jgi:hypothetical protein